MVAEENALANKTRKQVYNYIYSNPGTSFSVIMHFFDMKKSTLNYHLNYLERAKHIRSKEIGKRRCFYCTTQPVYEQQDESFVSEKALSRTQQRLIILIQKEPGITTKELKHRTKLKISTMDYNLNRLIDLKLIWKVKTDNGIGYEYITNEKLKMEIINRLLKKLLTDEIDEKTYFKIKKKLEEMDLGELEVRR